MPLSDDQFANALLPGLPTELIRAAYAAAPGGELESGKFASRESSAALAANTFGYFLDRPYLIPPFGSEEWGWPVESLSLEKILRFPWPGGRHPCLDALIETRTALIGIESKRFEPFRTKGQPNLSEAYWRPSWGARMDGYQRVRDTLRDRPTAFSHLDAAQLFKHALALRSEVHRADANVRKRPFLVYLYCEPVSWPDGRAIVTQDRAAHEQEISEFAKFVAGDEVEFYASSYTSLLTAWSRSSDPGVLAHVRAVTDRFNI